MRDIVERAQQRSRIKNRHNSIGAIRSTILHHAGSYSGDPAIIPDARFQIDDRTRAPAMGPEDLFAGIGDLDWRLRLSSCNRGDDLQRNDLALSTKPSSHQRLDHANLLHRHVEHKRELVL